MPEENCTLQAYHMRTRPRESLQVEVAAHSASAQTTHLVPQRPPIVAYHRHSRRRQFEAGVAFLSETYYLDGMQRTALEFDGAYFSDQLQIPSSSSDIYTCALPKSISLTQLQTGFWHDVSEVS